jgi:hypothetical protein
MKVPLGVLVARIIFAQLMIIDLLLLGRRQKTMIGGKSYYY